MTHSSGTVSLFALEASATLLGVALAFIIPRFGARFFRAAEVMLGRIARKRRLAVFVVIAAALLGRLALLPADPIPHPFIHDEFSYLLAADTFASGRLTNPTHPMWEHFESFHIDQLPTYMSMYPPAQGLVLAAGKRLLGDPWFGVWLSCGAMCGVICWMLQGWFSPGWALLGGLVCVIRISLFSEWTDSYNGGTVAAIGGTLVLGALPRLLRRITATHSFMLASGLAILANSRPWEGTWLGLGVAVVIIYHKRRTWVRLPWQQFWLPVAATLLIVSAGMGYYNWRVFGRALTLPYQVNRATYAVAPLFFWENLKPEPVYRHKEMREFYVKREADVFLRIKTFTGFVKETCRKAGIAVTFFFAAALLPPLIMLPKVIFDRRIRILLVIGAMFCAGTVVNAFFFPRYAAPATGILYAVLIQCMRHLRTVKVNSEPFGRSAIQIILVVCVLSAGLRAGAHPLHIRVDRFPTLWYGPGPLGVRRATVAARMEARPGQHLLVIRYAPNHDSFDEWVYNAAEIDRAKVVWAREMSPDKTRKLIQYFKDRQVWLVEPDKDPLSISAYPEDGIRVSAIDGRKGIANR